MRKVSLVTGVLVAAAAGVAIFFTFRPAARGPIQAEPATSEPREIRRIERPTSKPAIGPRGNSVSSVFTALQARLNDDVNPLSVGDITNGLIKPWIRAEDMPAPDIEGILTPKHGLPRYLTDEEKKLRIACYDAMNNTNIVPEGLQYWCIAFEKFRNMTNAVLRREEIDTILALYPDDWRMLRLTACRLSYGRGAYRDIPAARRIFEYIWKNCPPDLVEHGTSWKYKGLLHLAHSYSSVGPQADFDKAIQLFTTLDEKFTHDYDGASDDEAIKAKNQYFIHPFVSKLYMYETMGGEEGVRRTLSRFDHAFRNVPPDRVVTLKSSLQMRATMLVNVNRHAQTRGTDSELMEIFQEGASRYRDMLDDPDLHPITRQQIETDMNQALKVAEYLREKTRK